MLIRVRCADCGSKEEVHVPYFDSYNFDDYITLNETGEEKLLYKKYIERENYLHFGNPSIFMKIIILLTRLVKRIKGKLDT